MWEEIITPLWAIEKTSQHDVKNAGIISKKNEVYKNAH